MINLPSLTESTIRARTNTRSWTRGIRYYEGGNVLTVIWRDGVLDADIRGSEYDPYHVRVQLSGPDIVTATCTCPRGGGGDCKHIVAALLHLARDADGIEQRPSIGDLVAGLDHNQLTILVTGLVDRHPTLADEVERLASLVAENVSAPAGAYAPTPMELDLLRRQIAADMHGSIQTGYDSWGEEAWYDSDLGAALEPALTRIRACLDAGDIPNALILLETTTQAWDDGADDLDEYVLEYFEDGGADFALELGEYWAEAILMAGLSPDERLDWADRLEDMSESIFGGRALEIAVTAARDGWDAPALVAAMEGNITEKGAWAGDIPYYAPELAQIRLRILEQRGQIQEYLNLAQAEGQLLLYLQMLVKQGRSELAVEEAREFVATPGEAQTVAETLLEYGEVARAFALARRGLDLEKEDPIMRAHGRTGLAMWLRDQAYLHDQPDLALEAGRRALAGAATLNNYLALQEVAGDRWPEIKPEALQAAAESKTADGAVDIFLHERMYDMAIQIVDQAAWFYNIDKVIEAVKTEYPEWAFTQCCQQAEAIMDAGRAKDYDVAAAWLRRGRDILLAAGGRNAWGAYLADIMEKHHRKYKLMPMLRALQ